MPESALPTMLEQVINHELKAMLLHHDLPTDDYLNLARFLQNLENRRVLYEDRKWRPSTSSLSTLARTYNGSTMIKKPTLST
jgi:hypothetical protein